MSGVVMTSSTVWLYGLAVSPVAEGLTPSLTVTPAITRSGHVSRVRSHPTLGNVSTRNLTLSWCCSPGTGTVTTSGGLGLLPVAAA